MENLKFAFQRFLVLPGLPLLFSSLNCATEAMLWNEQARVTIRQDEVGCPFMNGTESFGLFLKCSCSV